jgi:hypothetical protein
MAKLSAYPRVLPATMEELDELQLGSGIRPVTHYVLPDQSSRGQTE